MRTIEEIKDQVAKDNGYTNWEDVEMSETQSTIFELFKDIVKESQKEVVKQIEVWDYDLSDTRILNLILENLLTEIENQ